VACTILHCLSKAMYRAIRFKLLHPIAFNLPIMSLYRLYRGDLALLLADGHDPTAAIPGQSDERFGAFAICPACLLPGLHMHTDSGRRRCHRCRAESLERLYDKLLENGRFTVDIKRMILWAAIQHPSMVYKDEARALRIHHMTDLLRGPPWTYNRLWTTREAMQQACRWGVTWKGKSYRVGRLSIYQDFLSLVIDFLF
jgi:hypothetical protein